MGVVPSQNLGIASREVNGQLIPVYDGAVMFVQNAIGPTYTGFGQTPPATIPMGPGGAIGIQQASSNAAAAVANPWSLAKSPVPALLIMFVVGFLMLRYIHWRGE